MDLSERAGPSNGAWGRCVTHPSPVAPDEGAKQRARYLARGRGASTGTPDVILRPRTPCGASLVPSPALRSGDRSAAKEQAPASMASTRSARSHAQAAACPKRERAHRKVRDGRGAITTLRDCQERVSQNRPTQGASPGRGGVREGVSVTPRGFAGHGARSRPSAGNQEFSRGRRPPPLSAFPQGGLEARCRSSR